MATLKLILDKNYTKKDKQFGSTYPLVIKVSHRSKWKNIQTGYQLTEQQWDDQTKQVTRKYQNSGRANVKISGKRAIANEVISIPRSKLKAYDVYQLVTLIEARFDDRFIRETEVVKEIIGTRFKDIAKQIADQYNVAKRYGSEKWMRRCITGVLADYGNEHLLIRDIDIAFLERFESIYLGRGNKLSGLGVLMRGI